MPGRTLEMDQRDLLGSIADRQFGRLVQQHRHGTRHSVADAEHAALNGQEVRNFKRWYPPGQRIGEPQAFAAA